MDIEDHPAARAYLYKLYTLTQGDIRKTASMYEIGESLGLDRSDSGAMAESLFLQELAELKTLSGGIGITLQGLDALDIEIPPSDDAGSYKLTSDPILDAQGKEAIEKLIQEIKDGVPQLEMTYDKLEEMVIDIKTIEIQMRSPNPKTGVIRQTFQSLQGNLSENTPKTLSQKINTLVS